MWQLITSVIEDLTTGSWITRSFFTALVVSALFSVGTLLSYPVQIVQTNLSATVPPIVSSGNDLKTSTTKLSNFEATSKRSGAMWTNSVTAADDGKSVPKEYHGPQNH